MRCFGVAEYETDYDALAGLLEEAGAPLSLAELHGGLCGVLCAGGPSVASGWLHEMLDAGVGDDASRSLAAARLDELADSTWRALSADSLEFTPLLPDDGTALDERATALGIWCHGFLAGLIVAGVDLGPDSESLSPDARELVEDLSSISEAGMDPDPAGYGAEADGDEDEDGDDDRAYFELVEFVRVGAQIFFEELLPDPAPTRTLH